MSAAIDTPTPASSHEEWKYGPARNITIVSSTSAIFSLVASLLLVWILLRSRSRFTTTYHRLILGMSAFDILFSLSYVTFGMDSPKDVNYAAWNARGNLATCEAFGFLNAWGACTSPMYSASLNLYYLARIKYNQTESYITSRLEPLFHAVPILYGLIISIILATQEGINFDGSCGPWPYNSPHCDGIEDGQIPDGFEIPCGRGNSFYQGLGGVVLMLIFVLVMVLIVPITIGGSLFMIYRSISSQERRMARYGENNFQRPTTTTSDDAAMGDREGRNGGGLNVSSILSSIGSRIRRRLDRGSASRNQDSSHSRVVSRRATAYSISYLLTWVWLIVYLFVTLTGMWPTESPPPAWSVNFRYFWNFFQPLQGLWNLLIYMHPKVSDARRASDRGNISRFSAFLDALWLATTGRKRSPLCRTGRRNDPTSGETNGSHRKEETAANTVVGGASAVIPSAGGTGSAPATH